VLDGEIIQALADGGLPQQLAGATAALQAQLLQITQEMQSLKSEMYSEQNGMMSQLTQISERAKELDINGGGVGGGGHGVGGGYGDGGGDIGNSSSMSSVSSRDRIRRDGSHAGRGSFFRERPLSLRRPMEHEERRSSEGRPRSSRGGRRVEFTPDTHDPIPMRSRGVARSRPAAQPGWTPYMVGFVLLSIGPLRPLLYELVATLPKLLGEISATVMGGGWFQREEELAWYEQ